MRMDRNSRIAARQRLQSRVPRGLAASMAGTKAAGIPATRRYETVIVRNPRVCGGEPVIRGTRVTLRTVLASLAEGASVKEILDDFPTLTDIDVRVVANGCNLQYVQA